MPAMLCIQSANPDDLSDDPANDRRIQLYQPVSTGSDPTRRRDGKTGWLKFFEPGEQPAEFSRIVQSWDTANKATELSDFSVCTTWGNRQAVLSPRRFSKETELPDLKRAVLELARIMMHGQS